MIGRNGIWTKICAALAVAIAALIVSAGLLAALAAGNIELDSEAARKVAQAINAARTKAKLTVLRTHPLLQNRAEFGAAATAKAFLSNPTNPSTPKELKDRNFARVVPGSAEIVLQIGGWGSVEQMSRELAESEFARLKALTHLAVGVCRSTSGMGQPVWVAVVIGVRTVPELDPERINQGQRDFYQRCHLCGYQYLGRLAKPGSKNMGGLVALCPKCKRRFDVFGIDEDGRYHRPPWFMRGFKPRAMKDPISAWLFVLTHCRYVLDSKQYGRAEVWQLAEQTYRKRMGDCEDTAILLADWLNASGFWARVVLGRVRRGGHAWVVISQKGQSYILETTGRGGKHRRMPPRAEVLTDYFPYVQFNRTGVWFRTSNKWTGDYRSDKEWARGPWPAPSCKKRCKRR
ncbi:MAG: hypothetical protein GXP25_01945 [Planctomycetes bacterium]|nr:hypothetical protein [Planctomycetota bacterium]